MLNRASVQSRCRRRILLLNGLRSMLERATTRIRHTVRRPAPAGAEMDHLYIVKMHPAIYQQLCVWDRSRTATATAPLRLGLQCRRQNLHGHRLAEDAPRLCGATETRMEGNVK